MRIFLTGHKGMIGCRLFRQLKNAGHEVVGFDCSALLEKWKAAFFEETYRYKRSVDCVIHCGAISDSLDVSCKMWDLNYAATQYVMQYAFEQDANLLFFSSVAASDPMTAYGYSKKICEDILQFKFDDKRLCIFRPVNVWSFLEEKQSPSIIYKMMTGALDKLYKGCERDFVYVDDVVDAVLHVLSNWCPGLWEIGTGDPVRIEDFCISLYSEVGVELPELVECPVQLRSAAQKERLLPRWKAKHISEYEEQIVARTKGYLS